MAKTMPKALDTYARQKRLLMLLEEYIKSCRPPAEADSKKANGDLPTLPAFAAFLVAAYPICKNFAPRSRGFMISFAQRLRMSY